jgi:hypothetical protein
MDPTYPVLMTCPVRNALVDTGTSLTREGFAVLRLESGRRRENPRFTCGACGGEHVIDPETAVLGDAPS